MNYRFTKMHGAGNDFLFLDDMAGHIEDLNETEVRYLCDRHFGIGADGVVILRTGRKATASWTFYNSDGSSAEMCGNAARCAVKFLSERHFSGTETLSIETLAGTIQGRVLEDGLVEITLFSEPSDKLDFEEKILDIGEKDPTLGYFLDTGVPHFVVEVKSLKGYPVASVGYRILNHPAFAPEKTNVTFFQRTVGTRIFSTTFERGVEQETLACGTGAAAAAIVYSELYLESLPIELVVPGGELVVDTSPISGFLLLRGPAAFVAEIDVETIPTEFTPHAGYGSQKGEA